jgi:hypothetical protein
MVASLAAAFAAAGASQAGSEKISCEIVASSSRGLVTLAGHAQAAQPLSGSYRFEVSGAGTQIRQAGPFGTAAGASATLGSVQLGGSGPYEATLEVSANGHTVRCAEWTGKTL